MQKEISPAADSKLGRKFPSLKASIVLEIMKGLEKVEDLGKLDYGIPSPSSQS